MNKFVGKQIRKLREKRGLSQEQVADAIYISQSTYARIESGGSHSWAYYIKRLADLYQVPPEYFLSESYQEKKAESSNKNIQELKEYYEKIIKERDLLIREMKALIKRLLTYRDRI